MFDSEAIKCVADIVRVQARLRPDAIAMDFKDRLSTYAELDARASRVAAGLAAAGRRPGARIGFLGKNSDHYFELLFGCAKSKTVLVAANWRLALPELVYVLNDARCESLFVSRDFYESAEKLREECPGIATIIAMDGGGADFVDYAAWRDAQPATDPMLPTTDEDVVQLYTSGTTGHPKGVQLTDRNFMVQIPAAEKAGLSDYTPDDIVLVAMPVFHIAGVNMGLFAFAHGARAIILSDVDPQEILRLIAEKRITATFLVPAVILALVQQPNVTDVDFSSLKRVAYGASPISDALLKSARRIVGCDFAQVYGLTETTGAITILGPGDHDPARNRLRSCGVAFPDCEIRVIGGDGDSLGAGEVGEIAIRSAMVMKGYWNKPEATAEAISNGWFRTGDAGYFDEDGYLYIHDRMKDMIVSGGENVYPAEVENAIYGHPAVADVAVIGVPDERWGEAVKAIVVRKPGASVGEREIIAHARERIAGYKAPKSVAFVDSLPRNPTGKILRRELREPFWEGRTRRVN